MLKFLQTLNGVCGKVGWTLIGRCNWSEYQKLSKSEKEMYVQLIEQKILAENPKG